jgi:hypothetical protein
VVQMNINEKIFVLHIATHRALKACWAYFMRNVVDETVSNAEEKALVRWNESCQYILKHVKDVV